MGYTWQEARDAWIEVRFNVRHSTDCVALDAFFEIGRDKPAPLPAMASRPCSQVLQQDEYTCHCGLRWDAREERPPCPRVQA